MLLPLKMVPQINTQVLATVEPAAHHQLLFVILLVVFTFAFPALLMWRLSLLSFLTVYLFLCFFSKELVCNYKLSTLKEYTVYYCDEGHMLPIRVYY